MSVGKSLTAASRLRPSVQNGAQAIEKKDRKHLPTPALKSIVDSLYLDDALKHEFPNDFRWDYIVSSAVALYGIETHTAATHEIRVLIGKRRWALDRLREHLRNGIFVRAWYWVPSGRVEFKDTGKAVRQLKQEGITFAGSNLRFE